MKIKIILALQKASVIFLVMMLAVILQFKAFGQDLSAAEKGVWQMVESYWNTWKEKTSEKLRPFYHQNYIHWGATYTWPFSSATMDPPPGYLDGVGAVIDAYELTLHDVRVWDNAAVAMYEVKVTYLGNTHTLRCTDIWMKDANNWQIIGATRISCSTLPKCQQGFQQSSTFETNDISPIKDKLPPIGFNYGGKGIPYGEGLHPGIDYEIPIGTLIVAVSDGIIDYIGEVLIDKYYGGGFAIRLKHADDFFSIYVHLSKVFVTMGQYVKRGERLGLSGQSNNGYPHLHFGLVKNSKKGSALLLSQSYNPKDFWLNGNPQCYDPHKDYSQNTYKDITFPVLCSESF
jgi:hypothetical protein